MASSPTGKSGAPPKDESSNLSCVLRVRPPSEREIAIHEESQAAKPEWDRRPLQAVVAFNGQKYEVEESPNGFASQQSVFEGSGKQLLEHAWAGYNTCFLAYGQTGAGKTYSMMGSDEDPGMIPRIGKQIFEDAANKMQQAESIAAAAAAASSGGGDDSIASAAAAAAAASGQGAPKAKSFDVQITVRYLEIYNEQVKDLLWSLNTLPPEIRAKANPENLRVRSSPATGVFVEHLTGVPVDSVERMLELIELGNGSRTVAATKMNERSSRSHAIFKIEIRQITAVKSEKQFEKPTEHIRDATMNLVDLAGSERNKKTGATGERLKEAANINKSLSCLKNVIDTLVDNATAKPSAPKKKPPYRDSTLTSLLMDSLGGNSRTYMLVCISPHSDNAEETLQTLKYGSKARQICTSVHVNENAAGRMLLDMEAQLAKLREASNQVSFSQTAEGHAKMELMKSDIEEKQTTLSVLEGSSKTAEDASAGMAAELAALENATDARALASLRRAVDDRAARRADHAKRYALAETRYGECRGALANQKEHLTETEFTVSQVENMIEANRAALDNAEVEVDIMRRRNAKLDLSRRELVRAVSDQEAELHRLLHQRMITIVSAKARNMRLKVEHRHFMAALEKEHERAKSELEEKHRKNVSAELGATEQQCREHAHRIAELEQKLRSARAAAEKVEADRAVQVGHLERDLEHLKAERERLQQLGERRLERSKDEWDQRDERARQKTEAALEQMRAQSEAEHAAAVGMQREAEAKRRAAWDDELAEAHARVQRMLGDAAASRARKLKAIDDDLGPGLERERARLEATVAELKKLLALEDDFAAMTHAVATQWASFPQLAQAAEAAEKCGMTAVHAAVSASPSRSASQTQSQSPMSQQQQQQTSPNKNTASAAISNNNSFSAPFAGASAPPAPRLRSSTIVSNRSAAGGGSGGASSQSVTSPMSPLSQTAIGGGGGGGHMPRSTSVFSNDSNSTGGGGGGATGGGGGPAAALTEMPSPPKSFFWRLVQFQQSRDSNLPNRQQIGQLVQAAERFMGGAKDVTSVAAPVKLT